MLRKALLSFGLIVSSASAISANIIPSPPDIAAKSWILMDAKTGYIITEKNSQEEMEPASLTKIMTSYVLSHELAEGRVSNDDIIEVSKEAWAQNKKYKDSSLMWIEPGKPVTLEELHKGVVIASGNDASTAVAEAVAGSTSSFADLMNQHAQMIGMVNSNFVNPHGLPAKNHFMSAYDIALLSKAAMSYEDTYKLYKEREFTYNGIRQVNRNGLLRKDSSVDGLKTGYTRKAGYCLATSAEKNDTRLISVVMGAKSTASREKETKRLLSYGFRYFQSVKIAGSSESLKSVKVWKGDKSSVDVGVMEDLVLTIPKSRNIKPRVEIEIDETLSAPIDEGDEVGTIKVYFGDDLLSETPALAIEGIERAGLFSVLIDSIIMLFMSLVK